MAQTLASAGTSAQILTHDRFNRAPVVQTPRRGRLPKAIASFWKASYERSQATWAVRDTADRIAKLRGVIKGTEDYLSRARYDLANLTQTTLNRKGATNV